MKASLYYQSITILFKYKGTTQEVQGIIFTKGKYSFKGSAIDRSFSYAKIYCQIKNNISLKQANTSKQESNLPLSDQRTIQEKIIPNLASYLSTMGTTTPTYHKLLRWNDKDEDEENEEIKAQVKSSVEA